MCGIAYFGLVQHVEQKDQYREQAGQRRHDAVAQTIQSVVHGGDPPVMQDEPQMGEMQNIGFYNFMPAM